MGKNAMVRKDYGAMAVISFCVHTIYRMCMQLKYSACTVRLLTHVHCKPTYFVFHSFKADMPYSLQTNFVRVIKDWAD